jgi:aminoglycoside/choline kinase family phosphotransferase
MNLNEAIKNFIKDTIGNYERVERLTGDASVRDYFRVHTGTKTWILCIDANFIGIPLKEYPFHIVHRLFTGRKIPVPTVYFTDEKNGLLLLEDGGDEHLQDVYRTMNRDEIVDIFRELIDIMIRIQFTRGDTGSIPFSLSFDVDKLMFEFDFFIEHTLLNYFQSKITERDLKTLRAEFVKISKILNQPECFVLNHRDYHSRNVLLPKGRPFIIDFQDARMGLPQYDAVSLLRDEYLVLEEDVVQILKDFHFEKLREMDYHKMSREEYEFFFDIMGFQRNVKALGTFGFQITSCRNKVYEPYITPGLNYLADYIHRRDELKKAGAILRQAIEVEF